MENFTIYNPVKLYFGNQALNELPAQAKYHGQKVLLVYGKNSIKTSGLYNRILNLLSDFQIIEFGGIKPNPIIEDVNKASKLAIDNQIDMIVAVGGGSVIDSAKVISVAANYEGDAWDIMKRKHNPTKAIPVLAVLTLAATGTEMNAFAVVQNHKTQEKIGWGSAISYPIASFLDPQLTTTVPANYTAYGLTDMIAHSLESYFGFGDSPLADAFIIANIKEIMNAGSKLMKDLTNYDLRARVMYAGTIALNGTLSHGKTTGDWGVHSLGHILSLLYDVAHGASLSIAYPAWMKLHSEKLADKIVFLGKGVFGVNSVEETIEEFEKFFSEIGSPIRCGQAGIGIEKKNEILSYFYKNNVNGAVHQLTDNDRQKVLDLMF